MNQAIPQGNCIFIGKLTAELQLKRIMSSSAKPCYTETAFQNYRIILFTV